MFVLRGSLSRLPRRSSRALQVTLLATVVYGQETLRDIKTRAAALEARGDAPGALAAWQKAPEIFRSALA